MDKTVEEIEDLKISLENCSRLLKEKKKAKDEVYTCRDVFMRISWHQEKIRCAKELGINIINN